MAKRRCAPQLGIPTKRDFEAIARSIRTAPSDCRCDLVRTVGDYFRSQNPRFDMARFARAAGCGDE